MWFENWVNILTCAPYKDIQSYSHSSRAIIYSELTVRAGVELPTLGNPKKEERGEAETVHMQYGFQGDFSV